jgi:nucleoid-associated protein YgaU
MGKVEKLAVLAVLFLIAVILVVSLTTDNPIDKANASVLGEKPTLVEKLGETSAPVEKPKLLSIDTGTPEAAPAKAAVVEPKPLAIPTGSLLKSTEGLSEGFDSKRLLYSWQAGDSYVGLAKRVYGEPTKFTLIQNANEGREDIRVGEKILVPVYDVENVVETPAPVKSETKAKSAKSAPVSAAGRTHLVKKGESLSRIAKLELGDSRRWNEIFELNKDKLKSPESLRDGMQLALP